jgi:hypothetical protein
MTADANYRRFAGSKYTTPPPYIQEREYRTFVVIITSIHLFLLWNHVLLETQTIKSTVSMPTYAPCPSIDQSFRIWTNVVSVDAEATTTT